MIGLSNKILEFGNIEEIKFTKVKDGIYSISIKSDISIKNGNVLENHTFDSKICKIDPTLELRICPEYENFELGNGMIKKSEVLSIPLNIKLLLDKETEEFFTIKR